MRVPLQVKIKDSGVVNSVYSNFSVSMNNVIIFHYYAYMIYDAFSIIKECEVSWFAFLYKTSDSPCVAC